MNQGEYGALTLWEQIDEGDQHTPTRKFLMAFPVFLYLLTQTSCRDDDDVCRFLLSTHYSHYDLTTFAINFIVLIIQLVAKLPSMHRVRILGINKKQAFD